MSFNLGVSNHPTSRLGGLASIGVYLYEDIYYRQWITEIALAFYEGRQDEFVWLDLVREFRNPEKQQIIPLNLTKEVIDNISILYKERPIYKVVDRETGKPLPKDQKLWEKIQDDCRYHMIMDKMDRWLHLLGTILLKVSFIDEDTGFLVASNEGGKVQLDLMHSGVYDLRHGASPYYITELLIGFGNKFGGFSGYSGPGFRSVSEQAGVGANIPSPSNYGQNDVRVKGSTARRKKAKSSNNLGALNMIYWSPTGHKQIDVDGNEYETENPYGVIPAVPFFNADPAHWYFLPINEPLIYANHTLNMRLTDLNHIAKYQSFGVPVMTGVERPANTRMGRPVDDFNQLRGGTAQSRFGGLTGVSGLGAGGAFRNFDSGFGIFRDGNADANALGFSIGPDTAIAMGEKGDFKFEHPKADITGLVKAIETMTDMVRVNHGLMPKYRDKVSPSGFALWMEKSGVIDQNRRRGELIKEREKQLFQVIKKLWNAHYTKSGEKKFSENAVLEITYIEPKFPVDPKTQMETVIIEQKIRETGDRQAYRQLYPYLTEQEINKAIKETRDDMKDRIQSQGEFDLNVAKMFNEQNLSNSITSSDKQSQDKEVTGSKIDNRAKHAEDSSKQPGKTGDQRGK
jgi:hypothetical protein